MSDEKRRFHLNVETGIEVGETIHTRNWQQLRVLYNWTGRELGVTDARVNEQGDLAISRHTYNTEGGKDGHWSLFLTKGEREMLTLWLAELSLREVTE